MIADGVAVDAIEGVKLIMEGGTSVAGPPTWEDALSTRVCVRMRSSVINSMSHETWRWMVREVCRIQGSRRGRNA